MASSVSGLGGVLSNLTAGVQAFKAAALAATEVSANAVYAEADSNAPVGATGDLAGGGHVEAFTDGSVQGFAVVYGANLTPTGKTYSYPDNDAESYAWFNELGTVNMPARPFLLPAHDNEVPNWLDELDGL